LENAIVSLSVGGCLIVVGLLLLRKHRLAWRVQKHEAGENEQQRRSYFLRYRRRMQIAGILIVVGIMVPVGDLKMVDWKPHPALGAMYWLAVILLCFWMILLALGDVLSIRARSRVDLAKLETKRRALEHELREHQKRRAENGQL